MFQYLGLRGECQEAYYNLGRAFHQLGKISLRLESENQFVKQRTTTKREIAAQ